MYKIRDFVCSACSKIFEVLYDGEESLACPHCGSSDVDSVMVTAPALQLYSGEASFSIPKGSVEPPPPGCLDTLKYAKQYK